MKLAVTLKYLRVFKTVAVQTDKLTFGKVHDYRNKQRKNLLSLNFCHAFESSAAIST
jgi:hypothetical protein